MSANREDERDKVNQCLAELRKEMSEFLQKDKRRTRMGLRVPR